MGALILNPQASQLRRYLLGQLLADEQAQIEQRLLADGDFFLEVSISEEELIDDYLDRELSDLEIKAFESHFLVTAERRKQLRFARRLATYLTETEDVAEFEAVSESSAHAARDAAAAPKKKQNFFSFFPALSPALSYSLAAVILVAVVGVAWLAFRDRSTPSGRPGSFVAVTLAPGLTRDGGEIKRIKPTSNDQVVMRLIVPTKNYPVYRTRLLADDNSEVWASGDLAAVEESDANVVIATIPPGLLTAGDYRAVLSGRAPNGSLDDVATYSLRVLQ